jgi:ELAV-like protein 1
MINSSTQKDKNNSLIVNYLPQSIKENDLREIFSSIGELKSCKLMCDKQTGYSYGFAFVEYLNGEEDGKLACERLNGLRIGHKTIRVTEARPQSNETRNTKLYIKGFPNTFNQKQFEDLFSPFGKIIQIRILHEKSIAFVIMSTRNEAQTAKDHLHGLQIPPSNTLYVKFTQTDCRRNPTGSSINNLSLYGYPTVTDQLYFSCPIQVDIIYVYGLSQSVKQSDLFYLFNQFGNVTRVDIIMDQNTGLSKGYAFVFMENYSDALIAIQQLNNSLFHGRYLQVRFKNNQINY